MCVSLRPRYLCDPKFYHHVHKILVLGSILSQLYTYIHPSYVGAYVRRYVHSYQTYTYKRI